MMVNRWRLLISGRIVTLIGLQVLSRNLQRWCDRTLAKLGSPKETVQRNRSLGLVYGPPFATRRQTLVSHAPPQVIWTEPVLCEQFGSSEPVIPTVVSRKASGKEARMEAESRLASPPTYSGNQNPCPQAGRRDSLCDWSAVYRIGHKDPRMRIGRTIRSRVSPL